MTLAARRHFDLNEVKRFFTQARAYVDDLVIVYNGEYSHYQIKDVKNLYGVAEKNL